MVIVDGGLGWARVGSLALAYLRETDGGSFAIYRLLCYIYNVWCFWGGFHYMTEACTYRRVEFGSGFGMIGTLETP